MELLIFGAIFILLHIINLVFFLLKFDKTHKIELIFSILEILSSTIGIGMATVFLTSFFTNNPAQTVIGFTFLFFMYALSIAFTVIKPYFNSKFEWCKWVIIGVSAIGIILTVIFGSFIF
jgi:hypothetical protein